MLSPEIIEALRAEREKLLARVAAINGLIEEDRVPAATLGANPRLFVMRAIRDSGPGLTPKQARAKCGTANGNRYAANNALIGARAAGLLAKKNGVYSLTDKGREWLKAYDEETNA